MENTATTPQRRPRRWGVVRIGLALVAVIVFGIISVLPPLVATDSYPVHYSVRSQPYTDAEVFRPVFMGHLLYIRLPSLADRRYSWFLVDLRRHVVSWPAGHYRSSFGFYYIHADQAFGIRLTDSKMEDHWTVSFEYDSVTFSNETIHVTVNTRSA